MKNGNHQFDVEIVGAWVSECQSGEPSPAFDVVLKVRVSGGHSYQWHGEVSQHSLEGNWLPGLTLAEKTFAILASLGFQYGQNLTMLSSMIGKKAKMRICNGFRFV